MSTASVIVLLLAIVALNILCWIRGFEAGAKQACDTLLDELDNLIKEYDEARNNKKD